MDAFISDLFARCLIRPATAAQTAVTAAGAGDNTEVNGLVLNLDEIMTDGLRSIAALIYGVATVANAQSLTMLANWQMAENLAMSANPVDVADPLALTTVFTASGAQTAKPWGVIVPLNYELVTAGKKYVRIQFTPDLTAGATDTATIQAAYILGQGQVLPYSRVNAFTNAS